MVVFRRASTPTSTSVTTICTKITVTRSSERPAKELLRAGNGGRQKREVRKVAEADEREKAGPASVDVPTEDPVEEFDEERGQWRGFV